jgi:hypothetical protein
VEKTIRDADQEFETLSHVILTSELEGDPSVLDHELKENEKWGDTPTINTQFDEVGDYKQRIILHHTSYFQCQDGTTMDDIIDQCIYATHTSSPTTEHEGILFYDALQIEVLEAPSYI